MTKIVRKFLIATHGNLATGVKSTLDIIIGQTENVFLIEAYVKENKGIESDLSALLKKLGKNEELIIFTDLLGGSITNQAVRFTQGRNVHIISGFNLALLIEVLMAETSTPAEEVIETAVQNAKEQIVYVTKLIASNQNENNND
jgi:fructoselysine and glucoselysine-specific PTS system IIA component